MENYTLTRHELEVTAIKPPYVSCPGEKCPYSSEVRTTYLLFVNSPGNIQKGDLLTLRGKNDGKVVNGQIIQFFKSRLSGSRNEWGIVLYPERPVHVGKQNDMKPIFFLERETPVTVFTPQGKLEPVETSRWKQVAVSEDLDALKAFFEASISEKFKARYRYQIISNAPEFSPVRLS